MTKMGDGNKVSVVTNSGTINDVDCLLWAIGRVPNIDNLHLDRVVSILLGMCRIDFFLILVQFLKITRIRLGVSSVRFEKHGLVRIL